jgi:hypothetical protein
MWEYLLLRKKVIGFTVNPNFSGKCNQSVGCVLLVLSSSTMMGNFGLTARRVAMESKTGIRKLLYMGDSLHVQ